MNIRIIGCIITWALGCMLWALAAPPDAPDALEARVSSKPNIPVVGQPVEIRLAPNDSGALPAAATITIRANNGRVLFEAPAKRGDNLLTAVWTPDETGFHEVVTMWQDGDQTQRVVRTLPVVWTRLHFVTWGMLTPDEIKNVRYISSQAIVSREKRPGKEWLPESYAMLKARGADLLKWVGAKHLMMASSDRNEQGVAATVAAWSRPLDEGYDGIFIDELGMYPTADGADRIAWIARTLHALRERNPNMMILPANCGALLPELASAYRAAECVALLETYPTCFSKAFASHSHARYFEQRIETARHTDLIWEMNRKHGAIVLLGGRVIATHEEPIDAELEGWVRHIKRVAPEMPGIGFYSPRYGAMTVELEDRLCLDYYIKPVISARNVLFTDYTPRAGETIQILANIHNVGGMAAKDVGVRFRVSEIGRGKPIVVGTDRLQQIGCGFENLAKGGGQAPFEYQTVQGTKYAVFPSTTYNTVFLARGRARTSWTPKRPGYYSVQVEIESSGQYTVLDGIIEERILVQHGEH